MVLSQVGQLADELFTEIAGVPECGLPERVVRRLVQEDDGQHDRGIESIDAERRRAGVHGGSVSGEDGLEVQPVVVQPGVLRETAEFEHRITEKGVGPVQQCPDLAADTPQIAPRAW